MNFRLPVVTIGLSIATLACWFVPGLADDVQFDRAAFADGAWWRALSGHFTHWTADHLAWDLAAFLVLGSLVERRSRVLLLVALAGSAVAIPAGVFICRPDLHTYRGLSGLDSSLFAALVASSLASAIPRRAWREIIPPLVAAGALAAKIGLESLHAQPLFVQPDGAFVAVPLAHLLGAAAGIAAQVGVSLYPPRITADPAPQSSA